MMKKQLLISSAIASAMLLTACGGNSNQRTTPKAPMVQPKPADTTKTEHNHSHGHSHGHGHDHNHSHANNGNTNAGNANSGHGHDHSHGHSHGHGHDHNHSHANNGNTNAGNANSGQHGSNNTDKDLVITSKDPVSVDVAVNLGDWIHHASHDFDHKKANLEAYKVNIGSHHYSVEPHDDHFHVSGTENVNFKNLGQGFHRVPYVETIKTTHQKTKDEATYKRSGKFYLFQQAHSAYGWSEVDNVVAIAADGSRKTLKPTAGSNSIITGEPVDDSKIDTKATYSYVGKSRLKHRLDGADKPVIKVGDFKYNVNFETKMGDGTITESDNHVITLETGRLRSAPMSGGGRTKALGGHAETDRLSDKGHYTFRLFGAEAQEGIGTLSIEGDEGRIEGFFYGRGEKQPTPAQSAPAQPK